MSIRASVFSNLAAWDELNLALDDPKCNITIASSHFLVSCHFKDHLTVNDYHWRTTLTSAPRAPRSTSVYLVYAALNTLGSHEHNHSLNDIMTTRLSKTQAQELMADMKDAYTYCTEMNDRGACVGHLHVMSESPRLPLLLCAILREFLGFVGTSDETGLAETERMWRAVRDAHELDTNTEVDTLSPSPMKHLDCFKAYLVARIDSKHRNGVIYLDDEVRAVLKRSS